MRRGFSVAEVLVALALAAGPLLVAINLIHSNVQSARFNKERATARMVLQDLVDLLMGEPVEGLRALAGAGARAELDRAFDERIAALPDEARRQYGEQARKFHGQLQFTFEEALDPEAPGLARMTLELRIDRGTIVRLVRLFRPAARVPAQGPRP